jgi:Ni,Fe-hydrogenase III small subunit/ferredoxin
MPWFSRGLRNGVVTTHFPDQPDEYAETFPAAVSVARDAPALSDDDVADRCPTGAIQIGAHGLASLDRGRCVLCGRCERSRPDVFAAVAGSSTARLTRPGLVVPQGPETDEAVAQVRDHLARRTALLSRSLHIRHVDAGSDGSEEWEVLALLNPVYDIHRLGIFFTASPRHADLLLVTGIGARAMVAPLQRTLEAMARPTVVIAAGADACSGGLFAHSYASRSGIGDVLPVDVWVPGSPPSPFSLLHALLLAVGRLGRDTRRPAQEVVR